MSVESITLALRVSGLRPTEKLVLIGIANHDGDGGAWPSVATLAMYADTTERTVQRAITALSEAGLVEVDKNAGGNTRTRGDRRPNLYHLHLDGVTRMSPRPSVTESDGVTSDAQRGDTAMSPEPSSNHPSSSLRSEDVVPHQVARDYWEWYKIEHNGLRPTIDFLPLRGVVKRLLKSGHEPDAIIDAMKTSKAWTAKALSQEIARRRADNDRTAVGGAIPHAIVRAFAKAAPFFERHQIEREAVHYWMRLAGLAASGGYGPGETMIRVALAVRAENATTWALMDAQVPRFEGELDDYADAMERAWTNRRWSVR